MYRLYTHNDLDGVGCGILAKLAFGTDADVRYNSVAGLDHQVGRFFERANDKAVKEDFLFITDLTVNNENADRMNEFVKLGGRAKLIDHHKTALHLDDYSWGYIRINYDDGRLTCATSLFYDYLVKNSFIERSDSLSEFVELVRQYDTWEWEQNDNIRAKQLNDLFFMGSIEEFEERMTGRIKENIHFQFDEFEQKLLALEEDKIDRYIRRKRRELVQTFIGEYCAGIVHAESYHSELGNELGKDNPHLDYIAILLVGSKKISFRTIHDNVDVSAIAGQFGGGGHAKAAGCSMTAEAYELFVQRVFPIEPMRPDAMKNIYNNKGSVHGVLYENRDQERWMILADLDNLWRIEHNQQQIGDSFSTFEEAERFIKRHFSAWLSRDEAYVDYLREALYSSKLGSEFQ
ncbi:DHH family phosphoesterase [Bacillus sp. T33-2]|uniref:DHH family phosphoesterase n=1 Tax=Bacillus sp. T33-2 TaxID=2054168 RepID=UPI000C768139|nr:DHHA1 domain-containing protein [Bacillus sp. T33-2]PLR98789.1 oligoribonuclease [Bacillus sp. T33-2]